MQAFGKLLFLFGLVVSVVGLLLWRFGGLGGLGRLPGDLFLQRGNTTFFFPLVSCLLLSLLLSLAMWLLRR